MILFAAGCREDCGHQFWPCMVKNAAMASLVRLSYQVLSYVVLGEIASSYKVIVVSSHALRLFWPYIETSLCFNIIFECIFFFFFCWVYTQWKWWLPLWVGVHSSRMQQEVHSICRTVIYQVRTGLQLGWCMVSYVYTLSLIRSLPKETMVVFLRKECIEITVHALMKCKCVIMHEPI